MLEDIKNIVINQLDLDEDYEITRETLISEFDLDSIDTVELIMSVEDFYNIEIPEDEGENFDTIGDIIDFLQTLDI